jgi:hypothetical protein
MTPQFSIEELRNFDRHHAPKYAEAVQKAREARDVKKEILTKQRQLDIERLASQILQTEELKKAYALKLENVNSEKTSLQLEYTSKIKTLSSRNSPTSPDFSHLESSWQQTIEDLKKDLLKYQSILDAYPLAVKNAKKSTVTLRIIGYVLAFLALILINSPIKIIAYLVLFLIAIPFCLSSSKGKVKQLRESFETALAQTEKLEQDLVNIHNHLAIELQAKKQEIEQDELNLKEEQESLRKNDFLEAIYESFESVLLKELNEIIRSSLKEIVKAQLLDYNVRWYVPKEKSINIDVALFIVKLGYPDLTIEILDIKMRFSTYYWYEQHTFTADYFRHLLKHPKLCKVPPERWVIIQSSCRKYEAYTAAKLLEEEAQQQKRLEEWNKRKLLVDEEQERKIWEKRLEEWNTLDKLKQQESKSYPKAVNSINKLKEFGSTSQTQNDFLLNNQKGDTPQKQNSDEGLRHTRKVMRHFEQSFKKAHGLLDAEQEEDTNQTDTSQLVSKTSADKLKQQDSQSSLKAVEDEHPPKVLTRLLGNETKIYSGIQNADDFLVSETEKSSDVTQPSYQQQEIFIDNDSFEVKSSNALPVVTPLNSSIATDNLEEELNNTLNVMSHVEDSSSNPDDLLEIEQEQYTNQDDTSQLVSKPSAPSKRLKVRNTTQRKRLQGNTANSTQPRLSPKVPTTPPPKKETDFPAPAPYIMRKTIELIAMEAVMAYEKAQGRFPEDVSAQNLGYDIDSGNETEERLIEVKGIATIANPVITENEYRHLTSNPNAYLYIVQQCNTENPQLYIHHQLGEHHFEAKTTKYEIAYADLKREVDAQCNLF